MAERDDGTADLHNCPKCRQHMTAPRLLSCWHLLCENCLADAIEGKKRGEIFQCFMCSRNVPVPWECMAEFTVPLYLQCEPEVSATNVTCNQHNEEVTMYCKKCDTAICHVCAVTEDCHKDHPCVSLRISFAELDSKKRQLGKQVYKLRVKINEKKDTITELDRQEKELTAEEEEAERRIETRSQQLIDAINRQKEEMKSQLRAKVNVEQRFRAKRRRDVIDSINRLEMITETAVHLMQNATPKELMLQQKSLSSSMANHEAETKDIIFKKDKVVYVPCSDAEVKDIIGKISGGTTIHSVAGLKLVAEFSTKDEVDEYTPEVEDLTADNAMDIVVPDRKNNNLKLFDRSGRLVSVWSGAGRHKLRCPIGVCCTSDGKIAICSPGNKKILFLDSQQKITRIIRDFSCTGAVFSNDHLVCTADDDNSACVVIFNTHDGSVVREIRKGIAGNVLFSWPHGIALTRQGNLVVTDIDKHCVYVMTMEGEVLHRYGRKGSASEGDDCLGSPWGVCVDQFGHILVTDKFNDRIHMLSPRAEFICHVVTRGNGLVRPQGIVLDQERHLIVSEGGTGKIKVFDYLI